MAGTVFPAERVCVMQFQFAVSGNRLSSVLAYGFGGTVDNAGMADLANRFVLDVIPVFQLAQSQDVHYQALYCTCLKKETAIPYTRPFITVAGLVAEDSAPSNVAVCIRKIQHVRSSKSNGRAFFAGLAVTQTTDGILTGPASTGVWLDVANALKATLTGSLGSYTPVIVSHLATGAVAAPNGISFDEVFVDTETATQRRRTTELREAHA